MQNRAALFLESFKIALANRESLPAYSDSPFAHYQTGDIEIFKSIVIDLIMAYLDVHDCTLKNKKKLVSLVEKLKAATQYSAVYTHLSIAIQKSKKALFLPHFSALLDYARNFPAFIQDVNKKRKELPRSACEQQASVYFNLVEAAEFETDLARGILHSAPKAALKKINNKIIDYCLKNVDGVEEKEETLCYELIKYHLCEISETISPCEKFIELLNRDLDSPQHVSECATLHLIFFNYRHIYDVLVPSHPDQLTRPEVNRMVRPTHKKRMFHSQTRGRNRVIASNRTKEFGITGPDHVPDWGKEWHRYETTPNKYRSGLNLNSPILKHFRSNGIPYIAGPSGTAADCAEGLYFLFPEISPQEIEEYFNLIAAAEVAQGHHSFHEIILPLCNMSWYPSFENKYQTAIANNEMATERKYREEPWAYLDYQSSYEDFLGDQFKETEEYKRLCETYPQYLDPNRHRETLHVFTHSVEESQIVNLQRTLRAKKTYAQLDHGSLWNKSSLTKHTTMNVEEIKKLSKNNVKALIGELGILMPEEIEFFKCFTEQTAELAHYTDQGDIILTSGTLLSYSALQEKYGKKNFPHNSKSDVGQLGNEGSVFFRYELRHQSQFSSRFGKEQFIVKASSTPLYHTGWVSLYEMFQPYKLSNVRCLTFNNEIIRSCSSSEDGKITYQYPNQNQTREVDMMSTVFFGSDIQRGIALAMIAELRRIGGQYQQSILSEKRVEDLNKALSQLFRVEAKIPGRIALDEVDYTYTAPLLMKDAIDQNDFYQVICLLEKGMSIDDIIFDDQNTLEYVSSLPDKEYTQIRNFLLQEKYEINFRMDNSETFSDEDETSSEENSSSENKYSYIQNKSEVKMSPSLKSLSIYSKNVKNTSLGEISHAPKIFAMNS